MVAPALRQAMELLRAPTLAGAMRERTLPDDVLALIKIAAGDAATIEQMAEETGEPPDRIRQGAILYLQSVVFAAGADHYRTLAVTRDVSQEKLRLHLSWLMKWLHPDRTGSDWASAFASRVLTAWDALKTRERREAYDRSLTGVAPSRSQPPAVRTPPPSPVATGIRYGRPRSAGPAPGSRRRKLLAAGLCLALATVTLVASTALSRRPAPEPVLATDDDGIGVLSAVSSRSVSPVVGKPSDGAQ